MKKIISKLKYVKLKDILGIFIFLLVLIPSIIYKIILKITNKQIWLICEQSKTARDNGYHFFKYMRENHKEIECLYVIDKTSKYYPKVASLGKVINWGGIKHYFCYMIATKNISSHKDGNPNQTLFTILHLYLNLYNNRIFLQHGITKDDISMFYYKNTKFKGFICGAKREYNYILERFGYPKDYVINSGFPRFDALKDESKGKNIIAIIPTWRNWLGRVTNRLTKQENFLETNYYKFWNSLINDKRFIKIIEDNNIELIFYPHIQMQKYLNHFKSSSQNIKIIDINSLEIQELLKKASLLITDYSSVYFDFAYMRKPVLYFQFDYKEYREKHLSEGYFNYENDGFGPICKTVEELTEKTKYYIETHFQNDLQYYKRCAEFFQNQDQENSKRVYEFIINQK